MMYVVKVAQKSVRAHSDPMPAAIALKVAKAWQSHGDQGVMIEETGADASTDESWTIREFIAYIKEAAARKRPVSRVSDDMMKPETIQATTGA